MSRKNPFRVTRIIASWVFWVAIVATLAAVTVAILISAVNEGGVEVLWQVALGLTLIFTLVAGISGASALIATLWHKAERHWDRKNR